MSSLSTPSVMTAFTLALLSSQSLAGPGSGGSKNTPMVDTLDVEGFTHQAYVVNGWADGSGTSEFDGFVADGTYVRENAQRVLSKGDKARAEHESFVHAERALENDGDCVTWSTELALDGAYDLQHFEGCEINFSIEGGPVGMCSEIARFSAVAETSWVDLYAPSTHWSGSIGAISQVPESLTDGLAYVYTLEMAAGDTIALNTSVTHAGDVDDPNTGLGGNTYYGYTRVELKTPRASVRLEASANRSQPGVFSNTDDDLAEYTALYSGTHRFEVVFADRLHVSGTNWRSDRRSNNTGDYYVESKAEVSFCP